MLTPLARTMNCHVKLVGIIDLILREESMFFYCPPGRHYVYHTFIIHCIPDYVNGVRIKSRPHFPLSKYYRRRKRGLSPSSENRITALPTNRYCFMRISAQAGSFRIVSSKKGYREQLRYSLYPFGDPYGNLNTHVRLGQTLIKGF